MKKISILLLLVFQFSLQAQTQDLAKLASGDYLGFNALFDSDSNLFGYVSLYSYGKLNDKTKKFEYVVLDKNLNPIANKEFEGDFTAANYLGYMDFKNKIILKPSEYDVNIWKLGKAVKPRSKEINLTDNSVKDKDYFEYKNGKFTRIDEPATLREESKENRAEKKKLGYNYRSYVFEIKEGGYIAVEFNDYGNYINNNSVIKFDKNQKETWRYRYNTSGDKKINESLTLLEKDENYIYFLLQKNEKKEMFFQLLVLDMKTGKEVHKKPITGLSQLTLNNITSFQTQGFGDLYNDKTFDDKIVLVGRNIDNKYIGFARMVIDRKTFEVKTAEISYESLKSRIPKLDKNGGVEQGYYLDPRDIFILKDGSVGILMEKYKVSATQYYTKRKTTDLVYLYTDKDFKTKGVSIFEKEKSKWSNSDYLFSQYLNDGKDVVFFFRDYQKDDATKDKNWNLYINTLIDGNFKQEMIPISAKDDFMVIPYVGKEGYILLREFNEKQKFNKIRLERLNY